MSHEGSVTRWIAALKGGDMEAAQPLWDRYFRRLVGLARRRLQGTGRPASGEEEDVALSAFGSLCEGAPRGRFPRLDDREDLWRLLIVITARKALDEADRRRRVKYGAGRVLDEGALARAAGAETGFGLDQMIGPEPSPEFAAMVVEEFQQRLHALGDETLRQVALWKMEGCTSDEIAARLGCARRSVTRRLEVIRRIWLEEPP